MIDDIQSSFYLPGRHVEVHDINALYMRLLQWRSKQPAEMDPIPYAVPNVYHLRFATRVLESEKRQRQGEKKLLT